MSISDRLEQLALNKAAIKDAIERKNPKIPPTGDLAQWPAAIESIPRGEDHPDKWVKPEMWPDIEVILSADTNTDYIYKRIELLDNSMAKTTFAGANAYLTSEGTFYSSNATVEWDVSKDIVMADGSRYRWVISYSSSGTFNGKCGQQMDLLWYHCSDNTTTTFNFSNSAPKMCQKIRCPTITTASFRDMTNLVEIEGNITTANVTNASNMFNSCISLKYLPSGFSCPDATNTSSMFQYCKSIEKIPDGFKTQNSTNATMMFQGCNSLKSIPEGFSLPNVTTVYGTFQDCYLLESLPDGFSLESVTNFTSCFMNCVNLKKLPSFDYSSTHSVTSIAGMCRGILDTTIPKFDFGESPITSYGDFSHASYSFPDVFIATNMTGTTSFPGGYLYIRKFPSVLTVNVPVNLQCGWIGSEQWTKLATFDTNGNVNGGMVYSAYDLTQGGTVTPTAKEYRLGNLSSALKSMFTSAQQQTIADFLNARGWTLVW